MKTAFLYILFLVLVLIVPTYLYNYNRNVVSVHTTIQNVGVNQKQHLISANNSKDENPYNNFFIDNISIIEEDDDINGFKRSNLFFKNLSFTSSFFNTNTYPGFFYKTPYADRYFLFITSCSFISLRVLRI